MAVEQDGKTPGLKTRATTDPDDCGVAVARLFRGGDFRCLTGPSNERKHPEFGQSIVGRRRMKNLNFLMAAYIAIWFVFCGYVLSVARRMANLKDDIRRLKQDGK
jgi:CcmD family protein